MTFGFGVPQVFLRQEETHHPDWLPYPARMEKSLRAANPGRTIEVAPLAVPGYSSHQGLAWMRRDLARARARRGHAALGWNDIGMRAQPDAQAMRTDVWSVTARRLLSTSQALLQGWHALHARAGSPVVPVPRVDRDTFVANHRAMVAVARAAGAQVVVIGPVYRDRASYPPEGERIAERRTALRDAMRADGVPYLEVPELTEDSWPDNRPLFLEHIHPNHKGHRLLAQRLLAFLAAQAMLRDLRPPRDRAMTRRLAWVALCAVGVIHWVVLLDARPGSFGGPPVTLEDWPKEYRYLAVLQQAVREGRVPYFLSEPIIFSRKYLAIPETCLSPQAALLAVVPPGAFVVGNTLLLYGAFCAGAFLLCRRYGLSPVPAGFLFLIAGAGGHVSAQMAVGHSMWTGFLLLPFVLLLVCRLAEEAPPAEAARTSTVPLWLAIALTAILLQGALHVFTACVLFLLLFAAFNPSRARAVLGALVWTAAAGCVRLLPAVFVARRRDTAFLTGYPSLLELARSPADHPAARPGPARRLLRARRCVGVRHVRGTRGARVPADRRRVARHGRAWRRCRAAPSAGSTGPWR